MPELPEVETMVRGIRPHLVGRHIVRTSFCRCDRKPILVEPDRATLQKALRRAEILAVDRLAKRVVVTLNDSRFLVVEPRMTGLLLVSQPPTTAHRRLQWHLSPREGLATSFEFWDRRGLGTVRLLVKSEMENLLSRLGPDPLDMSDETWQQQLSRTNRPVKNALLDQHLVVGIGNIYASEILHRARISPEAAAASLSKARIRRLGQTSRMILQDAIRYEGSTLGDGTYRNALNQNGSYQNKHRVYQRAGQLCTTCQRARIERIVQAQRSTFFCPRCQRR